MIFCTLERISVCIPPQHYNQHQSSSSKTTGCLLYGVGIPLLFILEMCWIATFPETPVSNLMAIVLLLGTIAAVTVFCTLRYHRKKAREQQRIIAQQNYERQMFLHEQEQRQRRLAAEQEAMEQERLRREEEEQARIAEEEARVALLRSLGDLLAMTPREFEEATGKLLTDLGYIQNVRLVGGTRDLGADLIGEDRNGRTIIVQCKRYVPGSRVGTPDLQRFLGAMSIHQADHGSL